MHCETKPYLEARALHTDSEIQEFAKYIPSPDNASKNNNPWGLGCCGSLTGSEFMVEFEIKVKPSDTVFYFATSPSRDVQQDKKRAYNKLKNQGMRKATATGTVKGWLYCPSVYVNPKDGKVHPRHIHYTIWDKTNKRWGDMYTLQVTVELNKKEFDSGKYTILEIQSPDTSFNLHSITKNRDQPNGKDYWKTAPIILHGPRERVECFKVKLDKIGVVNTWIYTQ